MTTIQSVKVSGKGLITGLPVEVILSPLKSGEGIQFYRHGHDSPIPARLAAVVNTDRGVTLANPQRQTLSIVEHFLCACALANVSDLKVHLEGAPELPILDGSAYPWYELLKDFGTQILPTASIDLPAPLSINRQAEGKEGSIFAFPSERFSVHYAVDFPHPQLNRRFVRWNPMQLDALHILGARTFGYVHELPAMQARGLAMGAGPENTLGLTDEGGYTDALRFEDEPIKHKILDLLGDLMLTGINPLHLKAELWVYLGGHTLHTRFVKQLQESLK